jgi:hypothetical protein
MQMLSNAGLFALLTLALDFVPLVMAIVYVVRPTERHLALMRPLSLAGVFAALAGGTIGLLNTLLMIGVATELTPELFRRAAVGGSESLVPVFVGFGNLTVAWLLIALGMGRQSTASL